MRRWLREPLLQFLVLGALLYGASALLREDEAIVVDQQLAEWLADSEARSLGRRPSEEELGGAVQRFLRMEVLRREARRLGLDRGDPIVERRLEQKMEFLLEGAPPAPDDPALAAWLAAHPERFARPATVAFEHRFYLREEDVDPSSPGAPFLGGGTARGTADQLDARFGPGFGGRALALAGEGWQGPLRSSYGWHLLRVTERSAETLPTLHSIRDAVLADWLEAARAEERDRRIEALMHDADLRVEADLAAAAR